MMTIQPKTITKNIDGIKRGLSGSEDMFSISTDFIENSPIGSNIR